MERILLLLDELEDLLYCVPLLWGRLRATLLSATPPAIACVTLLSLPLLASSATGFGLLLGGALVAALPLARVRRAALTAQARQRA
jgi:hypothetical protein